MAGEAARDGRGPVRAARPLVQGLGGAVLPGPLQVEGKDFGPDGAEGGVPVAAGCCLPAAAGAGVVSFRAACALCRA